MVEAGGSASAWQVLLLVRSRQWGTQSLMADALGISGATLTHHLNSLEQQGFVHRWRDAGNRRSQQVALTEAGEELFARLRRGAGGPDPRRRPPPPPGRGGRRAGAPWKLQGGRS